MAILRSPYAHANIRSVDTSAAKAMPGRGRRLRRRGHPVQPAPDGLAGRRQRRASRTTSTRRGSSRPTASSGPARASPRSSPRRRSRRSTRSTRSSSTTSRCPPSSTPRRPSQPGAPQLHENAPNNVVFEWTRRRQGRHRRRHRRRRGRRPPADRQPAPHPEPDGDPRRHRLVQPGHRRVHDLDVEPDAAHPATAAAAFVMGIPEHKIRCISPDVGGAFGTKIFCYADMRPDAVRQQGASAAGRSSGSRAGARTTRARSTAATTSRTSRSPASATARSRACGSRRSPTSAAASRPIGPGIPTTLYARVLSGCYKIPNVYAEVTGVYTNTTFVDAYRGAGRPEATYVIERAMDLFAAEIGMDRAEIRRRNFIAPGQVPVREPVRAGHRVWRGQDLHRLGQLRARPRQGARDGRLRGPGRRQGRGAEARQATSASASRPTSRCAASRPRSGSARSARAGAPRCGSRPTSRST